VCVCVFVCLCACMCVCVCVCFQGAYRERQTGGGERKGGWEGQREAGREEGWMKGIGWV